MGPESSRKVRLYMVVDGQEVEIKADFAEITFTEDHKESDNLALNSCEFSIWMKPPKSVQCRNRKRFVKLLMASGIQRNVAQVLARGYVVWSNQPPIPACMKVSYQSCFNDLRMRGIVSATRR